MPNVYRKGQVLDQSGYPAYSRHRSDFGHVGPIYPTSYRSDFDGKEFATFL